MDLRNLESQVLHEEAPSEQGSSVVGNGETSRNRGTSGHGGPANTDTSPMYNFNLSFEELSNVGLDELQRNPNPPWMVSSFVDFEGPCFIFLFFACFFSA